MTKEEFEQKLKEQDSKWRDRWERLHKIHVEDVRRRKEVRNFRAANFSIAELERALALKKTGKEPPQKENWDALVMAALRLVEDLIEILQKIEKYIPQDVQKQNHIWSGNRNYYARYNKLMKRFRAMRQEQGGMRRI